MSLRPLVIDDEARARVAKIVAYAQQKDHWYVVDPDGHSTQMNPRDNYRHVTLLGNYRCVFSWTFDERVSMLFRHLSVTVDDVRSQQHVTKLWTLAQLFGFTGWAPEMGLTPGRDWLVTIQPADRAVVLQQAIEPIPA